MPNFFLYETASGFALFEAKEFDTIGSTAPQVQQTISDFAKFASIVKLKSFEPFQNAANALENANDISEGNCFYLS